MENINIGVVNYMVSEMLKKSYFTNEFLTETEFEKGIVSNTTNNLLNIIKESPILQLEFKVFNNIENKEIDDDALAIRYIDDNIKLFEVYTLNEFQKEHEKLKTFINENNIVENEKIKLYNAINSLIEESLKSNEKTDVDIIHESFNIVLNHIKKSKKTENNNSLDNINEEVIEIAINKFNEKYKDMTLNEVSLFKKLINSNNNEKKKLFEEYKNDNIQILESLSEENENDKIKKSLEKINKMNYNPEQVDNDIIKLFELKRGLE
jgi:hypothetical protein